MNYRPNTRPSKDLLRTGLPISTPMGSAWALARPRGALAGWAAGAISTVWGAAVWVSGTGWNRGRSSAPASVGRTVQTGPTHWIMYLRVQASSGLET